MTQLNKLPHALRERWATIMHQQGEEVDLVDLLAVAFDIVDGLGGRLEREGKNRREAVLTTQGFAAVRIVNATVVAARNFVAVQTVGDAVLIGKGFARLELTERHPILTITDKIG